MEPLLTIRALINDKLGIIHIHLNDEDIKITLEQQAKDETTTPLNNSNLVNASNFVNNSNFVNEYNFDYSLTATKFKELLDCICEMPEICTKKEGSELIFVIESAEKVKYTSNEICNMPINKIPKGMLASIWVSSS
jgi:hypothetical protein